MVHVEKSLVESSVGKPRRNNKWVNLNEEHKYGLALSVSGGSPSKQLGFNEVGDNGRRYLESTTSTSAKDSTKRDGEHESIGMETLNGSGFMHMDHKDDDFRKVGFYGTTSLGIEEMNAETSHNRCGNGSWDLEANEAEPKSFFLENKLRRFRSRTFVFGFFCNLWAAYGSRVARNYTDTDSQLATDTSNDEQSWLGTCWARYQRFRNHPELNQHSVQLISLLIFALIILDIRVVQIA